MYRITRATIVLLACLVALAAHGLAAGEDPYRASGVEPFWSITMGQGQLTLDRVDFDPRSFPLPEPTTTPDGRRYDLDELSVRIIHERCHNAMSGAAFADRVLVELGEETLDGCGGEPLPPETLAGSHWLLETLDGEAIDLERIPSLVIDAAGTAAGFDGCNHFSGGLVFAEDGGVTQDDPGGVPTLMACMAEPGRVSDAFRQALAEVDRWWFEGDRLILSAPDGVVIHLRQTY